MLQLAERYAKLMGTKVLSHRIEANSIIFVLGSGQKLTRSTRELEEDIAHLEGQDKPEKPAPSADDDGAELWDAIRPPLTTKKKGRSKP